MTTSLFDSPLPQLTLFALSSALSPGPNNLLLAASGALFGARRSLPTLAGMYAGWCLMIAAAILGAGAVLEALPGLLRVLQFAGAGYLVYLAACLLNATWRVSSATAPVGFVRTALLQFLNPKLWLMTLATISLCTRSGAHGGEVSVPMIAFFVLATVPCMLAYLKFGAVLNSLAESSRARTVANRLLAGLTAASAILLLVPVQPAATDRTETLAARSAVARHFTGIGVARSTGTAVTEFCGEPSISRSA